MKAKITLVAVLFVGLLGLQRSFGQTTAMDFQGLDCNGGMHHLYDDLDAGNAVILEFFMLSCQPCITAGNALEAMKTDLLAAYPGRVKSYTFGFSNSYSCTNIANWVSSNGYSSFPMDSGAAQVAYYGGFGMPTVVILGGGSAHSILGTPYTQGFSANDTAGAAANIRGFLNTATAVQEPEIEGANVSIFPNPATDRIQLSIGMPQQGLLTVEVLDITGKQIAILMKGDVSAGEFRQSFGTSMIPGGCYLLRVTTAAGTSTHKIAIVH